MDETLRIAVATSDGRIVDSHFGRCPSFQILEVSEDASFQDRERRAVPVACLGGTHSDGALAGAAALLQDCDLVLVTRAGPGARAALAEQGISIYEIPGDVRDAVDKILIHREREQSMAALLNDPANGSP